MDNRRLGRSGIEVSPMGMGCWAIGGPWQFLDGPGGWGEVDDDESVRAVHAALANGITFFDTAATYGTGHSEEVLGRALAERRDEVVIGTKFGFHVDEAAKHVTFRTDPRDVIRDLRDDCERSLRHLGIEVIDLYQLHVWDYPADLAVELREALESLVQEGKIRAYGWSTDDVELARVFAEGQHCASVQHDLNVVRDAPEILALCELADLASINRSPLARGALTGKYSKDTVFAADDVRRDAWSMDTFFTPTLTSLDAVRDILTSGGRTLTQGALAWIWARSEKTVPIPGIRTVAQAEENAGALAHGPLSAEQLQQVDAILTRGTSPMG
ncbi:MAG: aldo/keto reductase [Cellulomonadaceae bacterium]|nr:aldo/keto reductase [Cellulomonadaceae bacterium]